MLEDTILTTRVTAAHIALARAWVNGLDLSKMGRHYLAPLGDDSGVVDLRVIKSTLERVLLELANAAHRNGIAGAAALRRHANRIRIDASGPKASLDARPTLEAFIADRGLEDYSLEDQQFFYEEAYPLSAASDEQQAHQRALARQGRLIKRQLDLISQLEPHLSAPIQMKDPVSGWFAPGLAERLEAAHIKTIEILAVAIHKWPDHWFSAVRGVGETKAARIKNFLEANFGPLDRALTTQGSALLHVEVVRPVTDAPCITPSQSLRLLPYAAVEDISFSESAPSSPSLPGKSELDGSRGRLRDKSQASAIEAPNDYEAMRTWLQLKASSATVKLYEREVTRLIAWSIQVRGRALSSLSLEDAIAYRDFLAEVPQDILIKKGPRKRSHEIEQALASGSAIAVAGFTKPGLKPSSIKKALTIISGFFSWLVSVRYVTANPFMGVRVSANEVAVGMGSTEAENEADLVKARVRRSGVLGRVLPREATNAIHRYLDRSPPLPKLVPFHARARFIFKLASMTGLRISEMAAARRDHLEYIEPDPVARTDGGWILHVVGKRSKHREVPMPDELIDELAVYLAHRGLLTLPSPSLDVDKGTFLIGAYPNALTSTPSQTQDSARRSRRYKPSADGVRPQTIHLALKELFARSLKGAAFKDEQTAEKMRKASAHWLRHTLGTRAVAAGTPVDVVAGIFGHASISTTSIYVQAERDRKISEMRKLWRKG